MIINKNLSFLNDTNLCPFQLKSPLIGNGKEQIWTAFDDQKMSLEIYYRKKFHNLLQDLLNEYQVDDEHTI